LEIEGGLIRVCSWTISAFSNNSIIGNISHEEGVRVWICGHSLRSGSDCCGRSEGRVRTRTGSGSKGSDLESGISLSKNGGCEVETIGPDENSHIVVIGNKESGRSASINKHTERSRKSVRGIVKIIEFISKLISQRGAIQNGSSGIKIDQAMETRVSDPKISIHISMESLRSTECEIGLGTRITGLTMKRRRGVDCGHINLSQLGLCFECGIITGSKAHNSLSSRVGNPTCGARGCNSDGGGDS